MLGLVYVVAMCIGPCCVSSLTARKCLFIHVCVTKFVWIVFLTKIAMPSCCVSVVYFVV